MSERRPADDTDLQAALDGVADALYALVPDDFAAARDAQVRLAREGHQAGLAREIAKLRKPTQSAWLINLLWRDQHAVMEQLFELANELSRAQADAAGPALRELTAQRRQLEVALLRRAVELGTQAGVRVSESVAREAQETLSAALAVPAVADEVRTGRLVKSASYAGFGGTPPSPPAPARQAPAPIDLDLVRQRRADAEDHRSAAKDDGDAELRRRNEQQAREREERAEAERARAEAERRLAQTRRDAERASIQLVDTTRAAEDAHARAGDLQQQAETLKRQLARVEADAERAQQTAADADAQRREAEEANTAAVAALQAAEHDLTALGTPSTATE